MKHRQENTHIVDLLFVLGLFFVFTISALFLILIGSGVYQKTVEKMNENFDSRTSFAYLTEKIRQNDCYDSIQVGEFDGRQALILNQTYDDIAYSTYLYVCNGYLKELFTTAGNELSAGSGQDILPVSSFSITKQNEHLLRIQITTSDDKSFDFLVSTRCSNS